MAYNAPGIPSDGAVTAAKLAGAVQGVIPNITLAPTDNANGTGDVLITVKDAAGNALAGYYLLTVWLADNAFGSADNGEWGTLGSVAQSGIEIQDLGAGTWEIGLWLTKADGTLTIRATVDAARTVYIHACLGNGPVAQADVPITMGE